MNSSPFSILGYQNFKVDILNCNNVWNTIGNLTAVDYIFSQTTSVVVPAFVNTTTGVCNSVITTFDTVSGFDLSTAITLVQTNLNLGTSLITINTMDTTLRGSYTLKILCTDTSGVSKIVYMPLII